MRDIKFRGYSHSEGWVFGCYATDGVGYHAILMGDEEDESCMLNEHVEKRSIGQYTGLKDKNGEGLIELYEGDIISHDGKLIGNIYENDKREADLVIPEIGTKAWEAAYKEAVDRGFNYAE